MAGVPFPRIVRSSPLNYATLGRKIGGRRRSDRGKGGPLAGESGGRGLLVLTSSAALVSLLLVKSTAAPGCEAVSRSCPIVGRETGLTGRR